VGRSLEAGCSLDVVAAAWALPVGAAGAHVIRVIVVSTVRLYREGLASSLAGVESLEVVGALVGAADSLDTVRALQPDVVLLDASGTRAADTVRVLADAVPAARVVALAVSEVETDVIPLAEAGVAGYLTTEQSLEELAETIESVAKGETLCSPSLAAMLLKRVAALADAQTQRAAIAAALTTREREILELIDLGLSNKEIARDLRIEVPTVKNHVHNILGKLHVERRAQAAAQLRI
jgi:two-component system, NarL family, nitrate/nitrite response regulator NarL